MSKISDLKIYYMHKALVADGGTVSTLTADSGTVNTIVDAALTEADDYWNGALVRWLSGDNFDAGVIWSAVKDFTAGTDTVALDADLPFAVSSGDTYKLYHGGNYRSADRVVGLDVADTTPANCGGTIDYVAHINGAGTGTLKFYVADSTYTWTPPGGTEGSKVTASTSTSYVLFGGGTGDTNKSMFIEYTTPGTLPAGNATDSVVLTVPTGAFMMNVIGAETSAGTVICRPAAIKNNHASGTIYGLAVYATKSATSAAATTTAEAATLAASTMSCTSLANWPSSGWVLNTTKNDCRPYYNRSGNDIDIPAVDWTKLAFDAGDVEITIGQTVTGAGGATGVVVAIQVNSGTWAGNNAAGYVYLKDRNATAYVNDENLAVGGSTVAVANGADVLGFRDKTAVSWDSGDAIELMPEMDIAIDAPSTNAFENPANESTLPAGLTFSCPRAYATGLVIGDLAATAIYGIWERYTIWDGTSPRAGVVGNLTIYAEPTEE